jgi:hypothetical protein
LILIALQELCIVDRGASVEEKLRRHAIYVAAFLVLAHIAMIAGMLDPSLLSPAAVSPMHGMHGM